MRFRAAFVTVLVLATGACAVVDARESGRRDSVRYQDDVALDFDDEVQCYRVRDHADHFFHDGWFYRYSDGDWYQSRAFRGPWRVIRVEVLPSRLERWAQFRRERFEEPAREFLAEAQRVAPEVEVMPLDPGESLDIPVAPAPG